MPDKSVVCVVLDGLAAGSIGCYGSATVQTDSIDDLAAQSVVLDQTFAEEPTLEGFYRSLQGCPPQAPRGAAPSNSDALNCALESAGYETVLVTDDDDVLQLDYAERFERKVFIDEEANDGLAAEPAATLFARVFRRLFDEIKAIRPGQFWLIHLSGLARQWDAPVEYQEAYAEDESDGFSEAVPPPQVLADQEWKSTETVLIRQAYAAQITLADDCVGELFHRLMESDTLNYCALALGSCRGMALGEHGRVGLAEDCLYEEVTHLPWMMRFPETAKEPKRSANLATPFDVSLSLLRWLGIPLGQFGSCLPSIAASSSPDGITRDRICSRSASGVAAIRTPAWHLIFEESEQQQSSNSATDYELYVKPDDRWDFNNVADLCPEVAAELYAGYLDLRSADSSATLAPLPEALVKPGAYAD